MISTYSNVHRSFLQACSLHGTLTVPDATKIMVHLFGRYQPDDTIPDERRLQELIDQINPKLSRYQQKIVLLESDPKLPNYVVFANLSDSPLNRLQTTYPAGELSFFRVVLHELAATQGHKLEQIEWLNLTAKIEEGRNVTKSRAEELLTEWVSAGYLVLDEDGIGFGPKTQVEFDRYLLNNFPDQVEQCRLCKEVLFYGIKCAKCPVSMHKTCAKKYFKKVKNCPACKKPWTVALD
uniref:Non-structural maintenance of chromosomes element 1 homolog n=1 Tax=Culex tarsalis TaxID=7177 RepID=A0A1Q3F251_CULTA